MAKQIHKKFETFSQEGKEFIKLWNKGNRDGLQKEMAEHFGMSVCSVQRIRDKLGLYALHSGKHPGRQKLIKRIKRFYYDGRSTLQIAKILRMSPQSIQNILHKTSLVMKPQHCVNPLYYSVKNLEGITLPQFLKEIRHHYTYENMSAAQIAKKYGVDQGTISNKLKAMDISLRQNHNQVLEGGYPCQWCATIMDKVYQNKGIRKQKFCGHSCKNKAKDYRRMIKGGRGTASRLQTMEQFLKESWGHTYEKAKADLLNVRKCIKEE